MATWHTSSTIKSQWSSAPRNDALVNELLEVAKENVLAFAPALPEDAGNTCPTSYRLAQGIRAREIWDAQNTPQTGAEEGAIGLAGYQLRVYPMGRDIRAILRPAQGVPGLG